jgi:N6-L-threonylcarbamoyladenine synthase
MIVFAFFIILCFTEYMKILAIETSCDETAFAILEASGTIKSPIYKVIKNIVSSQIAIHREWGGVVPNLAKREHMKNLPLIFEKLKPYTKDIDVIAVTVGPGLEPALWTGIEFAKELHRTYFKKAKLIGVNHMEGHLFSNLLFSGKKKEIQFPAIGLIVSGGHTILIEMKSLVSWKKLGETLDDAVGEAFDKVARVLGLPYPGGPEIQAAAERGNEDAVQFPRPMLNQKDYPAFHCQDAF